MKNNFALFLISFLFVFFSFGCISAPDTDSSISTPDIDSSVPDNNYSKIGSLKIYYPNPHADYPAFDLSTLIQESDIIVEAVVVDMSKKRIISSDYGQVSGIPREIQDADYTMQVNDILKTDQNIGEVVLNIEGNLPDLNVGDRAVVFIKKSSNMNSVYTPSGLLILNSDIYAGLYHQISFDELKGFVQKSDVYLKKYHEAAIYYDIAVVQMLTDTNVSPNTYSQAMNLPHQIHEIEVIYSSSGKLKGRTEFDYRIWYLPEKIVQDNDLSESFDFSGWVKNEDGWYAPNLWDPETSFLKKGDYYLVYFYKEDSIHYEDGIIGSYILTRIPKYDSKTQNELRQEIEEYQELYKLVDKYENRPWKS